MRLIHLGIPLMALMLAACGEDERDDRTQDEAIPGAVQQQEQRREQAPLPPPPEDPHPGTDIPPPTGTMTPQPEFEDQQNTDGATGADGNPAAGQ